jgi:GTPase Era involved in 16S rRNA processing
MLGKAGSGKSSLINYLYGEDILKTGAGKSVTPSGEFKKTIISVSLGDIKTYTFYDSWGLEANKSKEWQKEIEGKLSAKLTKEDFICGAIYCISYAFDRIEEFEINILNQLISKGYKVVIVLTNADCCDKTRKNKFRDELNKKLSGHEKNYNIVDVCSVEEEKILKTADTSVFGKEELLAKINDNIHENFTHSYRLAMKDWLEESRFEIFKAKTYAKKEIAKGLSFFKSPEKQLNLLENKINIRFSNIKKNITRKLTDIEDESAYMLDVKQNAKTKTDSYTWGWDTFSNPIIFLVKIYFNFKFVQKTMMRDLNKNTNTMLELVDSIYEDKIRECITLR